MKLDAKYVKGRYDFIQKGTIFEFFCYGDQTGNLEKYLGKKVNLELKGDKRSSKANGYLWVLLGELQEVLKIPKEEIYRTYIREIGSYDVYCMQNEAVPEFKKIWQSYGVGWVCDTADSKLKGCTNVLAYKGTSEYSKEEMAVLLGKVVDDCIEQGIPTKPKEEIESLLEAEYSDKN